MSKRRIFDIDFPSDPPSKTDVPAGTETARRSPMASAIAENAEALEVRVQAEQAIRAENDKLAHDHVRLKKAGLITDLVAIDKVRTTKLTRDRSIHRDPDLDELVASIRDVGLSNPIRVEPAEDGTYELVQGFRRLSAFRALYDQTQDPAFAKIPAALVAQGDALDVLYRKMVDENLVRRGVSFAEMAQLAMAYAVDPDTPDTDVETAVATLYASAGRQKRSYIRRFALLLEAVGDRLSFPEALPRALGLELEKRIADQPSEVSRLHAALTEQAITSADQEQDILRAFLKGRAGSGSAKPTPRMRAKTTLRCDLPEGALRLTASNGKVEMSMDRDFAAVDRARLEAAVTAFVAALRDSET